MLFEVVSEGVAIREALRAQGAGEASNTVVEGFHMSAQCEAGSVGFLAILVFAVQFLHPG